MIEIDWHAATDELDRYGSAMLRGLLAREDCEAVIDLYEDEANFRKRVAMAQHGFGRGEYKYFPIRCPPLWRNCARACIHRSPTLPIAGMQR